MHNEPSLEGPSPLSWNWITRNIFVKGHLHDGNGGDHKDNNDDVDHIGGGTIG